MNFGMGPSWPVLTPERTPARDLATRAADQWVMTSPGTTRGSSDVET